MSELAAIMCGVAGFTVAWGVLTMWKVMRDGAN